MSNTILWALAVLGLGSVLGGWTQYITTIPRDKVPRNPVVMFITQAVGLVLAIASLVLAAQAGSVPGGLIAVAGFAIFMGSFFFILYTQRKTPLGELRVEVGGPMLAFAGVDSEGNTVNSDDWRGRRILLKFFRGSW
jgi:FtsH-binding integral membrane protein